VGDDFAIDKVFLEADMPVETKFTEIKISSNQISPPHRLHLTQAQRVVLLLDAYGRELVGDFAAVGLEPCNERLVALEVADHILRIGRPRKRPRHARLDHAVARKVYDAHLQRESALGA